MVIGRVRIVFTSRKEIRGQHSIDNNLFLKLAGRMHADCILGVI